METYAYVDKDGNIVKVFHTSKYGAVRWDHKPGEDCVVCKPKVDDKELNKD